MSYTHDEMIVLPGGARAIMSGVPDACEHDYSGPTVLVTASGRIITWRTFPQWAGYTDALRVKLIQFRLRAEGENVVECTTECNKCGKVFQPPMW